MAPKRTTRSNPADTTTTTSVTNAQPKAMIDQGLTNALAARDADRNTNGVLPMPTLLTTKGALGQVRNPLAINVEPSDTSRGILAKYQDVIVCAKKIVRIPWGNETLIVRSDGSDRGNETRLNIISCTKMQKYMLKGCPIFLAHITTKETKDKSENKRT
ncbi:hypothetical protein Tco_1333195 [Tanacetum coccineum]